MGVFPYLKDNGLRSEPYIVNFRGVNYSENYTDGEFAQTENLTSEKYPCITPRRARTLDGQYENGTTLATKDGLVIVADQKVYYSEEEVGTVTAGRKQIATVGNLVCIFPDKKYFDVTEDTLTLRDMGVSYKATGLVFTDSTITTTGADWPFRAGDAVKISGCTIQSEDGSDNNKTTIIREVSGQVLKFYENTLVPGTETGSVTLEREIPDLEFVCESNYRLYGVKGNTIHVSKYGDPLNFFCFDGLTGDSYYIDVGSDGAFTGCAPFSSHVCFFKETTLHKLYGSKPSNFQVITSAVDGVQAGSERSMALVNETLIYKGVHGIYAYGGGIPDLISENFGTRLFSQACAAYDGSRYYISMCGDDGWNLYAYDVRRGFWLREDSTHAVDMTTHNGMVYILTDTGAIERIDQSGDRSQVEWSAEFCPFTETMDERKGYSRFNMRVEMEAGAWLGVEMKTDQDDRWTTIWTTHNERKRIISVPIIPTRCDAVSIRVHGKGDCTIRAFVRDFSVMSDR